MKHVSTLLKLKLYWRARMNHPQRLTTFAKLLLGHMGYPVGMNSTNCIPTRITNEEHALSWKRAKEYTSAGISGLHFGMFKAQAEDVAVVQFDAS
jgi:hypothetical protein